MGRKRQTRPITPPTPSETNTTTEARTMSGPKYLVSQSPQHQLSPAKAEDLARRLALHLGCDAADFLILPPGVAVLAFDAAPKVQPTPAAPPGVRPTVPTATATGEEP